MEQLNCKLDKKKVAVTSHSVQNVILSACSDFSGESKDG